MSKVQFDVYPRDVLTASVGSSYTNTLHLQLPEGDYVVIADYAETELRHSGPIGGTISVKYGQSVDKTIDLGLGHFLVTVHDNTGQVVSPDDVYATAYPAGTTDSAFASTYPVQPARSTCARWCVIRHTATPVQHRQDAGTGRQTVGGGGNGPSGRRRRRLQIAFCERCYISM